MKTGYHASHEQFPPSRLLDFARMAEQAGFDGCSCSDHFHPWSDSQGHSGYSWSWLGAALQSTELDFGAVCAPGYRYHPAIVAQSAATLAEMFPGRFWLAIGSGQFLNEGVTGNRWPSKPERNARLRECADIMRALWSGDTVTRADGVRVEQARLYTLPPRPPLLLGAAITPETAGWLAGWADGLITISQPRDKMEYVVDAFRNGGGEDKPMFLKVQVSYAQTDEEATAGAWDQWRTNVFDSSIQTELRLPAQFSAAARFVTPEDVARHVRVSTDPALHAEWLNQDLEMGFERVFIHNVNRQQEDFIGTFGERVLPELFSAAPSV